MIFSGRNIVETLAPPERHDYSDHRMFQDDA